MSRRTISDPLKLWFTTASLLFLGIGLWLPCWGHAEVVRIGGTGSGLATMGVLAKAFQSRNPEFQFEIIPSLGSSGGIKAVSSGVIQIALSNRALKPAEAVAGLQADEYARTPFVFVTSKSGVKDLALTQIAAIYAGRQPQWHDGSPVRLVLRDFGDSDNTVIAAMSPEMKEAVLTAHKRKGLRIALNDQEGVDAVEEISGGFGASTLALVRSENRRVNVLAVNGVEPTIENLKNGRYPYFKEMHLIHFDVNASVQVKKFLGFIRSSAGQGLMTQLGNLPVKAVR